MGFGPGPGLFFWAALMISSLNTVVKVAHIQNASSRGLLKEVESCAQDYPFHAILVAFAKSLPHGLFFRTFSGDTDPGSAASCSICRWRILLYLSEFNPLRWDIVSRIGKIEHSPKRSIWVRLGNLKQGKIWGVRRGQGKFIERFKYTAVGDGPLEVPGCFAANDSGATR